MQASKGQRHQPVTSEMELEGNKGITKNSTVEARCTDFNKTTLVYGKQWREEETNAVFQEVRAGGPGWCSSVD